MIISLSGKITYQGQGWIILETKEGIGYQIFTKSSAFANNNDENKKYFIYHNTKEDREELYGFETMGEREFFIKLISVSGVGPKMAMAIVSGVNLKRLVQSIQEGDTTFLTTVSGVGKKLASKIIVELKSKIGGLGDDYLPIENDQELQAALKNLGYNPSELNELIRKIPSELKTTEEKLKWSLKNFR